MLKSLFSDFCTQELLAAFPFVTHFRIHFRIHFDDILRSVSKSRYVVGDMPRYACSNENGNLDEILLKILTDLMKFINLYK